jgi:hypothetical protein
MPLCHSTQILNNSAISRRLVFSQHFRSLIIKKIPKECFKEYVKSSYSHATKATPQKFDTWLRNMDEWWLPEILGCLRGQFPDWRSSPRE